MIATVFVLAVSMQSPDPAVLTAATVRAEAFDLAGAADLLSGAAGTDLNTQIAAVYLRGLVDAREASRLGGTPESLAPLRAAIAWLEQVANGRPGTAEIVRLMLHAAAAAAQSERDEMRLYLDTAIRMETVQQAAGMPGAPIISAAVTAGDLWLQVHRYAEALKAYEEAAQRAGVSLRTLAGRGRAARGLNQAAEACVAFRTLLDKWFGRPAEPPEIAEARAYVVESCVLQGR